MKTKSFATAATASSSSSSLNGGGGASKSSGMTLQEYMARKLKVR